MNQLENHISTEALEWCVYWTEYAPMDLPSARIQKEFRKTRPVNSVLCFRYVASPDEEHLKSLLSWSPDLELIVDSFFEGSPIWLRMAELQPNNILVDMRKIIELYPRLKKSLLNEIVTFKL